MFGLGPSELVIIAIIVLLIFGAKRLPEIGKGMGGAIREFKNIKKDLHPEEKEEKPKGIETAEAKAGTPTSIESKVAQKVLGQVPGVKRAMDVKNKAEKVRDLLK